MNVVSPKGSISWDRRSLIVGFLGKRRNEAFSFVHDKNAAMDAINRVFKNEYVDSHRYVFVPASFELLIYDLRVLGMLDFKIVQMWERGNEFIVALQKTNEEPPWNPKYRKLLLHLISRQNMS